MRRNPDRTSPSETNLARRLELERENRGWTYEHTAKLLSAAGAPIQPSGIFKIEKQGRRIVVDELVAFAKIFEVDVAELLRPFATVQDEHATRLVTAWGRGRVELTIAEQSVERSEAAMKEYFTDTPAVRESMEALVAAVLRNEESPDPDAEARRIFNPSKRRKA